MNSKNLILDGVEAQVVEELLDVNEEVSLDGVEESLM